MGGAGGGQINIITRSGTAHSLHGTDIRVFICGMAPWMPVIWFNDMGMSRFPRAEQLPELQSADGLAQGKTFFFVNYEGLRNVETMAMVDTVPTALEDTGDFLSERREHLRPDHNVQPNPNHILSLNSESNPPIHPAAVPDTTAC